MNDRVVKNPNFKNSGEFHRSLAARPAGTKDWPNTHTEIEHLGNGKLAASIGVGHRVFFDKADGNKPKKHKLTDERTNGKDYVLVQGAKCCIEVYPYYAKYFDVQHEEVRLYEERWVVQRLFKEPDTWRDVGAYNPRIAVEEYPEPAGDVVKVTITYDTDYGTLAVEYFQRDGNALKHNVTFKNTSGSPQTCRVLQRWAGIVGAKCNGKNFPLVTSEGYLAFHKADKPAREFSIAENLRGMMFNPDGTEKKEKCLQRPVKVEAHAQGMKADFCYAQWVLAQGESLEIDPDSATLDDPTEDGFIEYEAAAYYRYNNLLFINFFMYEDYIDRGYVEWDVSSIPDGSTITDTIFKYHGAANFLDGHIHEMLGARPSTSTDSAVYAEAGEGTVYADPAGFPVVGAGKEQDLGTDADSDLQNTQLALGWFAIGLQSDNEAQSTPDGAVINPEEEAPADPKPTLYVEYTLPAGLENKSANMGSKMVAAGLI